MRSYHLVSYDIIDLFFRTYNPLSVFLNTDIRLERGLKAETSKYGDLTCILPRGAKTFPSKSGMLSLALCTISMYRVKSFWGCGSKLNFVSDSLKGVTKSRLKTSVYKSLANPRKKKCV